MGTAADSWISWELWAAIAVAFLWATGLIVAFRRRWFARLRGGFTAALTVALVGSGVITTVLLGMWTFQEARRAVFGQLLEGLANVDRVAEGELLADVRLNVQKMSNVADPALLTNAAKDPESVRAALAELQRYNHRLLQISLYDGDGKAVVVSTTKGNPEPPNRVGAAYAVDGRPFVSDPYVSTAFGRRVLYISVPILAPNGGNAVGGLGLRYDLQDKVGALFESARFGNSGYAVLLDHDGKVLAHHDPKRVGEDLAGYRAFAEASAGRSGWLIAPNRAGVSKLFLYRPMRSPATVRGRDLVLLTEMDADEAMAPVARLRSVLLAGAAVLCVAWAILARVLGRYLTRPLADLLALTARVRDGDLAVQSAATGRDEIGRFAEAFNAMILGLRERDRVKQLFGRYVTTQVSERVLKQGVQLGGQRRQVSMLFADIRNFTSMAEAMQPEQVVELLNDYFSEMVEAVVESGGVLDKFIGDGMLAVFGGMEEETAAATTGGGSGSGSSSAAAGNSAPGKSPSARPDHRRCAVLAGLRMKAKLAKINGEREFRGLPPIHIGIGIHTDDVVVGHIGSRDRVEHTVIGDGVNTCSRVESMNKELGTTLLITEQTHEPIAESFECRAMPETKVKGKSRPLRVYEVLSARQAGSAAVDKPPLAPQTTPTSPPPAVAA
jgi:class 3 adenylate cyclase